MTEWGDAARSESTTGVFARGFRGVAFVLCLVMGLSAFDKIVNLVQFSAEVQVMFGASDRVATLLAVLLTSVELLVFARLLFGDESDRRRMCLVLLVLLVGYSIGLLWHHGTEPCACFSLGRQTWLGAALDRFPIERNGLLIGLAAAYLVYSRRVRSVVEPR